MLDSVGKHRSPPLVNNRPWIFWCTTCPTIPEGPGGKVPISIYMEVIMFQKVGSHPQQVHLGESVPGEPHVARGRALSRPLDNGQQEQSVSPPALRFLLHWASQ